MVAHRVAALRQTARVPPRPVRLRLPAPDTLAAGFAAIRAEIGVPGPFPADAVAEAERATDAHAGARVDRTDILFVTVDPAGSMDLDQALHIERRHGGGFRVHYAIADVAAFVVADGFLDREAWVRGVTHYSPDERAPLYPPALSEGLASLLPDGDRAALLWTIDLDAQGERVGFGLERARVRSRERLTYEEAEARIDAGEDGPLGLLREVGLLREARERDRGGVSLPVPEQEVEPAGVDGSAWALRYRAPLPVEGWNAQISLLTGMAAADLMLEANVGFLRTVPAPEPSALARLRAVARALGAPWPADRPYPEFVRSLDPAVPAHAAILRSATGLMRGAGYVAFDGAPPPADRTRHAAIAEEYAHVTAPLRRLADRYANECCLAATLGTSLPAWVHDALPRLAEAMKAADRRASGLDRAVVDLVEASLLAGREGETFAGVVIDVDSDRPRGTVQLSDPAVRGRIDGADLPLGEAVQVRLVEADPATRQVRFAAA
jgi:exoribonuclease R